MAYSTGPLRPRYQFPAGTAGSTRREFVLGASACWLLAGLNGAARAGNPSAPELRGSVFDLTIGELPVNFTGRERRAITVNGTLPAPVLHWQEGDTVTLRVTNTLREPTSIHWHGILLPADMDGVPGLSFPGIGPGETFTYRFPVRQSGTYWYHSHSGFQEQLGLYGALVIHPRSPETAGFDRDYTILLSDWTDDDPAAILARLKKEPHYYNFNQPTVGDLIQDVRRLGLRQALGERREWAALRMNRADLADVSGYTYRYLVNGQASADPWTGLIAPGERVRLRFINAAAMTYFDVRIPGLPMTVIAADGQPVAPVVVDEFRIGVAETFDVVVTPDDADAYAIFAQSLDRSGYAAAMLARSPGGRVAVPALEVPATLTMADMGHGDSHAGSQSHAGHDMHDMSAMTAAPGVTHAPAESGPGVDMRARSPMSRLSDPGVGLRGNGRRVLTYADLTSAFPDPDGREPSDTIELHLTGNMERYMWSFNGVKASAAQPIRLPHGARVRFVLVNDSMMNHPIHLHGLWSDLEDEAGRFKVRKHTLNVKPGERLTFRVTADALGRWAFHCHLMLHMELGMFREVHVDA